MFQTVNQILISIETYGVWVTLPAAHLRSRRSHRRGLPVARLRCAFELAFGMLWSLT